MSDVEPARLVADEELLDWAPGLGYSGRRGESPAQTRRRQRSWGPLRRRVARLLGWLV